MNARAMVTRVGGCAAGTCARDSAWEMTRVCASALRVDAVRPGRREGDGNSKNTRSNGREAE